MFAIRRFSSAVLLILGSLSTLADEPPRGVDLNGDPLPSGALARMGSTRFHQVSPGTCLAFAPDDKLLATGSTNGVVSLWNMADGREVATFKGHTGGVTAVRFTPSGKSVISAAHDGTLRLWDLNTGKEKRRFDGHQSSVNCLAVSSDGKTLYSGGFDRVIRVWEIASGKQTKQIAGHLLPITLMDLSADDKQLVTASRDGTVRLWDPADGKEVVSIQTETLGRIDNLALSPDGKLVLTATLRRGGVRTWDTSTGKEVRQFPVDAGSRALALAPDGKTVAICARVAPPGNGVLLKILHVASGEELHSVAVPGGLIHAVSFSHDGKLVAASSNDSLIRVVDISTGKLRQKKTGHLGPVTHLVYSADGKHIFTAGGDQSLRVWETSSSKELAVYSDLAYAESTLALRPTDGKVVHSSAGRIIASADATALARGDPTAFHKQELSIAYGTVIAAACSADGKLLAVSSSRSTEKTIHLIDCVSSRERGTLPLLRGTSKNAFFAPMSMALTAEGRFLAARCSDNTLRFWDVGSGKEIRQIPNVDPNGALLFSPDGRSLLAADTQLHLWETCTGRDRWRYSITRIGLVTALAFSPDGRLLAVGQTDGSIALRAFGSGKELAVLESGPSAVLALRFSPDGQRLASGGSDSTVLVWDVAAQAKAARREELKPAKDELAALWQDLANSDAGAGHMAIEKLAAGGDAAATFIKQNLKPIPQADDKVIAKLITNLDDDNVKVREQATSTLEDLGEQAVPALKKALEADPSLEARTRIQKLLDRNKSGSAAAETLRTMRAIEVLEQVGTKAAHEALETLSRDEKSPLIAQEAQVTLERLRGK